MIVLMRPDATPDEVAEVVRRARSLGLEAKTETAGSPVRISVSGDTLAVEEAWFQLAGVARVVRLEVPYPLARSTADAPTTRVRVGPTAVGGDTFSVIAGPCAVEGRRRLLDLSTDIHRAGATMLRGGAFKPRTSPYAFRGLGEEGLEILVEARARTGLPIVTEIPSERYIECFERHAVDLYQVGARNMFDYELLGELGRLSKPVLLKRAFGATLDELLLAAEHLLHAGNPNVVLCERGIRSFETAYRFTLDLNAVAYLRERTHLPIVVDPSHGTGDARLVERLALAAAACGAHGVMVEVHAAPHEARSDGRQQLTPPAFARLVERLNGLVQHLSASAFSSV